MSDNENLSEASDYEFSDKPRSNKIKSGFSSLGLSQNILRAITKKGYRVPTPIQRKSIPQIASGKDVVAMARTGSGKSAAFIIPMLEKLKEHKAGKARALILSPSRELALQTLKFCKDLGKFTDLRCALVVGGDGLEDQFEQMATSPDILLATPGRLLHLLVEMGEDLKGIEYVCFDEADRLFEMGFKDTLYEILHKMPKTRQTVLFSATLPKSLVEFAQAGLKDPTLIRLDADTKISPDLKLCFFPIRENEKDGALLYLIQSVIPENHQTIIFASTKHHVEYLQELLLKLGIQNSYIYGSLDQSARNIHLARFRNGVTKFLIVTDVAARGIDIPLLNNVIHYDFPDKAKLFVHRSGRAARAGKVGTAYSLLTLEEIPYLIDLQLFLSRKLIVAGENKNDNNDNILVGGFPVKLFQNEVDLVEKMLSDDINLHNSKRVSENGMKQYKKTKASASKESQARTKEFIEKYPLGSSGLGIHPVFMDKISDTESMFRETELLDGLRNFRPAETIFEIRKMGIKTAPVADLMGKRRNVLDDIIKKKREQRKFEVKESTSSASGPIVEVEDSVLQSVFGTVISNSKKRKGRTSGESIPYLPKDYQSEKQYSLSAGFTTEASQLQLDITSDEKSKEDLKWDKKRKRYIKEQIGSDNKKRIKTETGKYIDASYKTDAFEKWKKKHKVSEKETRLSNITSKFKHYKKVDAKPLDPKQKDYEKKVRSLKKQAKESGQDFKDLLRKKSVRSELKNADVIRKERKIKEKRREKNARPSKKRKNK